MHAGATHHPSICSLNGWLLDARYRKMDKEVTATDQRLERLRAEIEQLRHVEREDKHIVLIIKVFTYLSLLVIFRLMKKYWCVERN